MLTDRHMNTHLDKKILHTFGLWIIISLRVKTLKLGNIPSQAAKNDLNVLDLNVATN